MSGVAVENVLTGKVINYIENCGTSCSKVKALVQVGTKVVDIDFEFLQYEFVRNEYPVGSQVGVAFYGGEWHFDGLREKSRPLFGVMRTLESVGRQASTMKKGLTGPTPHELWENSLKVDVDADISFIKDNIGTFDLAEDYGELYIRHVEMDFVDHADEVLEKLDLSYLRTTPRKNGIKCT